MTNNSKLCANGLMGYDIESGQSYTVRKPCASPTASGSIYCTKCRAGAGGYLRKRVYSAPTERSSNTVLYTEK